MRRSGERAAGGDPGPPGPAGATRSSGLWLAGLDIGIRTSRAIAVLLAVDGLAYLSYSFTDFLAPNLAADLTPWIQLPAPLAEGAFSLWLLVLGVNLGRWTKRYGGATQMRSGQVEALP
jgi:hypothetical protein